MPEQKYATAQPLIKKIADWAASRPLSRIHAHKGGWEGYAQVELAIYLEDQLGGNVAREEVVYEDVKDADKDETRADIVYTPFGGSPYIIELKCESLLQDWSNDSFANRILSDMIKCDTEYTARAVEYKNTPALAIGICVHEPSINDAIEIFENSAFGYIKTTYWTRAYDAENGPMVFFTVFE
ncbi:hypothetical protein FANTH_10184 [Fusarium anthophilum]|uniref:Uncharacterized protein n=1 Tax=Fusarium anthophilum TaxID=48485 RepID=A0A8H4Z2T3_9HYPO|nr:hypothetical protein FANTH_10184 [Fusarium anthophilum]